MNLGLAGKIAIVAGATSNIGRASRFGADSGFLAYSVGLSDADRAMRARRTLVGRPFAVPEGISGLAAFLASDRASFVTGQIWSVDGGSLL